jgi:type I restriction enzyme S subunit
MKGHDLEVPSGWRKAPLGEQVTLEYGASLPVENRRDGNVVVLGSSGVIGRHNKALQQGPGIVVGRKGTVGSLTWVNGPYWPIDTTYFVKPLVEARLPWLFRALSLVGLDRLDSSTGVPGLNRNDAYPIPVLVPDLAEQARIAEVLDTLDEAIQKTEQILLKRQFAKQGLLHDLLRVGLGENGEIRDIQKAEEFKATEVGLIPSTWVVRSLEQIATNHDGKRIPLKQADRVKRQGPFPYYGASGVIDSIDDYLFDGTYVLLGEDGENVVSRNLPLAFVVTGKFWPNNHAHVYEPQPGIKAGFLVELLETSDFSGIVSGSAQPKLTQEALRRLRFAVPPPPEQELILKLIEASNEALRSEKQQLEKLNQMKSGLAADLLTGRVRVRDGAPA